MDRKYIEDHHVVARFLADQLSDSDREAFEAYCLANPEMFRELEATARFKVGLAKLEDVKQLQPLLADAPARPFWLRHAAVVAGLLVGGTLIYSAVVGLRVPVMGATVAEVSGRFREALPVVGEVEILRLRDSKPFVQKIPLPSTPGIIPLHAPAEDGRESHYRAILRTAIEKSSVAELSDLIPDDENLVTVFVNPSKLAPGAYELYVFPQTLEQSDGISPFRIEFIRAP